MRRDPEVVAVILNFNRAADTIECVQSLEASDYPKLKLMIVDNCSVDDSYVQLQAACGRHDIFRTDRNLGFTGGMNYCFRMARQDNPEYIISVNNDTVVDPAAVRLLVQAMEKDRSVAAATGTIYAFHDKRLIWFGGGRMINWRGLAIHEHKGDHMEPRQLGKTREVSFVTGCVVIYRVSSMDVFGLEDERFFMYLDDIELSARIRAHGFRLLYVPQALIYHKVLGEKESPLKLYYSMRNRLLYIRTSLPAPTRLLATVYFLATMVLKLTIWRVVRPWAWEAASCGLRDSLKGRFYEGQGIKRFAPKRHTAQGSPT